MIRKGRESVVFRPVLTRVPRLSEFRMSFFANFAGIDAANGPEVHCRRGQRGEEQEFAASPEKQILIPWPAGQFCSTIIARLKRAGFAYEIKHVIIEKGGHMSCLPSLITANRGLLIDGDPSGRSPQADARGGYRSWAETMDFFHRHLDR